MQQDAYHIIARSAFGDLYFWGEKTGSSLHVFAPGAFCIPEESLSVAEDMNFEMQLFFGALDREGNDFENMFTPALRRLGRIKYDEMYGFVPALALGGASSVDHLERVKAVEHLVMLAQLAPLRVITSPFAGD